jgi:hypothetical protein
MAPKWAAASTRRKSLVASLCRGHRRRREIGVEYRDD